VDLEHFFDGYKFDPEYALLCGRAAQRSGAAGLVLCDTNGGSLPWDVSAVTKVVRDYFPRLTIGVHAHNDGGLAVANSLSAVRAGAGLVQGTVNGIGERTGNADLCTIVPSLALHMKSTNMTCTENLTQITKLSRFVDELLNRSPNSAAPYVGISAFAHKGGLHVAAMERSPLSYQHVDPQAVGNEKRVLVSELSGRQNILGKMEDLGVDFGEKKSEQATAILNRVKALENFGYTFEGADASVRLMILHASNDYCAPFRVLDYSAQVFDVNMDSKSRFLLQDSVADDLLNNPKQSSHARATIKVRTVDTATEENSYLERLEVSDGTGPVDALASALKRCLIPSYEQLQHVELIDYKVRILDPQKATAAATRVMVEFRDKESDRTWTTVSVDTNVISASLNALVDGFEYALLAARSDHEMCLLWEDE
jgi:2-isopropylmalate synthase